MKKTFEFLNLTLILGLISLSACSSGPQKQIDPKSEKLNQIVDQYFESYLKLEPLYASGIGDHRYDAEMSIDISAEHRKAIFDLIRHSLEQVQALNCKDLNHQDTLTCETFTDEMSATLQLLKVDLSYLMPFNQFGNFATDFAELTSGSGFIVFNQALDYENTLKRMDVVPAYVDAAIKNLKLGVKQKITTPRSLVKKALKQLYTLTPEKIEDSLFYKPILKINEVVKDNKKVDELTRLYQAKISGKIYPAYQKLQAFIKNEYLPHTRTTSGIGALSGGKEMYLALARANTTTALTPDEIMNLGYAQVKRIKQELEDSKNQLGFNGTLPAFFKHLQTDPKFYPFKTADDVLNAYRALQGKLMEKIPDHFRLMPKEKLEVREVEKFKAETASESYQNGAPDGSRPGIFWVPIPNPRKYPKKDIESLFLHEAIPGHHFQISIQQELTLPRYRRFSQNNAYVEGWALYCESLGKELGVYKDPYQWIGRLSNEMHRAVRLVVDTGIHWKGWSREKAIRYSLENEPYDRTEIMSEIDRYMAIPGQALAYKIGELKILELKAKAKQTLRELYDDRDFHDQILMDGALPLSVLENKMNAWMSH